MPAGGPLASHRSGRKAVIVVVMRTRFEPFPHCIIDARLPAPTGALQGGKDIRIEANRGRNLGRGLLWTAPTRRQGRTDRGNSTLTHDHGMAAGGCFRGGRLAILPGRRFDQLFPRLGVQGAGRLACADPRTGVTVCNGKVCPPDGLGRLFFGIRHFSGRRQPTYAASAGRAGLCPSGVLRHSPPACGRPTKPSLKDQV